MEKQKRWAWWIFMRGERSMDAANCQEGSNI